MIKHYCDKCGKELKKEERYRCDLKVAGFSNVCVDRFACDYCEECLANIIGKENLDEMNRRKEERKSELRQTRQVRKVIK